MNKDMVSPMTISKIAGRFNNISYDYAGSFGVACYEEGMKQVIKQIARISLFTGGPIPQSKHARKATKKLENMYQNIVKALKDNDKQTLDKLGEAYSNVMAAECEDHYIEGFIRGYQYLMNYLIFHSDIPLGQEEQEKSPNAANIGA